MSEFTFETFSDVRSKIRLLTIYPGSPEDPLCCSLKTFSLASFPTYEAVSYTWGDNAAQNPFQINGERFVAFGNAHDAFIEHCYPVSSRLIWIDAICVHQQDLNEKQHQILLMKAVYERASRVVVWLSRPRGDAGLAVGLLHELNSYCDECTNTVQSMLAIHELRLRSPEWIALRNFLGHPWWFRIWTLQEAVVGRQIVIQFGRYTIQWERIRILGDYNTLVFDLFFKKRGEGLYSDNS